MCNNHHNPYLQCDRHLSPFLKTLSTCMVSHSLAFLLKSRIVFILIFAHIFDDIIVLFPLRTLLDSFGLAFTGIMVFTFHFLIKIPCWIYFSGLFLLYIRNNWILRCHAWLQHQLKPGDEAEGGTGTERQWDLKQMRKVNQKYIDDCWRRVSREN